MTEQQILELQLECNGMKMEILNLRVQVANVTMPHIQKERDELMAKYNALPKPTLTEVPKE